MGEHEIILAIKLCVLLVLVYFIWRVFKAHQFMDRERAKCEKAHEKLLEMEMIFDLQKRLDEKERK